MGKQRPLKLLGQAPKWYNWVEKVPSVFVTNITAGKSLLKTPILILCLAIIGSLVYLNSFSGVFLFDDSAHIVENQDIRQFRPPWRVMAGSSRPLVMLSLAFNYALGRLDTWSYHAFNLSIHILAALTLFGIMRRTLLLKTFHSHYQRSAPWLALAVALIWLVHPLQTNSVTYIIQRAESMMGLFYLLTLYCFLRGATSLSGRGWFLAAVIACTLGMLSKPIMITAPLIVLLYDRTFLSQSFASALRRRGRIYLGLAATWIVLILILSLPHESKGTAAFGLKSVSAYQYALTQPKVILHYLFLSLRPCPLALDYSWPVAHGLSEVLPSFFLVGTLLILTVVASVHRSPWGFIGAWFFLILAPTSSFIPLQDLAFEHRMYLSLAAVMVILVLGGYEVLLRIFPDQGKSRRILGIGFVTLAVLIMGVLTVRRNQDYFTEHGMWSDVVSKRPANYRAHSILGETFAAIGKFKEAILHCEEALRIKPDYAGAYANLGIALHKQGKFEEAIHKLRKALRLKPKDANTHVSLGATLYKQGNFEEAITHFNTALQYNPQHPEAHYDLGTVLDKQSKFQEASYHYRKALEFKPEHAEAHNSLGAILANHGNSGEAVSHFSQALRIKPDFREARNNLRLALIQQGI